VVSARSRGASQSGHACSAALSSVHGSDVSSAGVPRRTYCTRQLRTRVSNCAREQDSLCPCFGAFTCRRNAWPPATGNALKRTIEPWSLGRRCSLCAHAMPSTSKGSPLPSSERHCALVRCGASGNSRSVALALPQRPAVSAPRPYCSERRVSSAASCRQPSTSKLAHRAPSRIWIATCSPELAGLLNVASARSAESHIVRPSIGGPAPKVTLPRAVGRTFRGNRARRRPVQGGTSLGEFEFPNHSGSPAGLKKYR
jgi:hypothetical protein